MAQKYFGHSVYQEGDSKRGLTVIDLKETMYLAQNCLDETDLFLLGGGFVSFQLVLASNVWMESLFGPDIEKWMRNVTLTYSDPGQI